MSDTCRRVVGKGQKLLTVELELEPTLAFPSARWGCGMLGCTATCCSAGRGEAGLGEAADLGQDPGLEPQDKH